MEWLQSNWVWIALGVGLIAFHIFGHGGHGNSHGGHSRRDPRDRDGSHDATATPGSDHAHADGIAPTATSQNYPPPSSPPVHAGHNASPTPADGSALASRKKVKVEG
jgi:hypothetical protein